MLWFGCVFASGTLSEPFCDPLVILSPLLRVFTFGIYCDVGCWTTGTDLLVLFFVSYFIFI